MNDTIDLRKKKSQVIDDLLTTKQYDKIENSFQYLTKMHMDMVNEENREFIEKCEVYNIPSFVLFKNREYIERIVGANLKGVEDMLDKY